MTDYETDNENELRLKAMKLAQELELKHGEANWRDALLEVCLENVRLSAQRKNVIKEVK